MAEEATFFSGQIQDPEIFSSVIFINTERQATTMATIPPDPTGGYGANYVRELMARNGPGALRSLQSGTRVAVQAVRSNPRIVQAIVRTGGSTALRAAGLTGIESGITCMSMETTAAAGGVLLAEIVVPVAIACVAIWVVYTCVSYWQSLPPSQRGYGQVTIDNFPTCYAGALIKSDEYGAPARSAYQMLSSRSKPNWTQVII